MHVVQALDRAAAAAAAARTANYSELRAELLTHGCTLKQCAPAGTITGALLGGLRQACSACLLYTSPSPRD